MSMRKNKNWFARAFGFVEHAFECREADPCALTRAQFACTTAADGTIVLQSRVNNALFHVGRWSFPSVRELDAEAVSGEPRPRAPPRAGKSEDSGGGVL